MTEGFHVLNTYSPIGWKWAQREDAIWMMDLYLADESKGTMFGLKKNNLGG